MIFHIVTCIFHLLRAYYELNAKKVLGIYGIQTHLNDHNKVYPTISDQWLTISKYRDNKKGF